MVPEKSRKDVLKSVNTTVRGTKCGVVKDGEGHIGHGAGCQVKTSQECHLKQQECCEGVPSRKGHQETEEVAGVEVSENINEDTNDEEGLMNVVILSDQNISDLKLEPKDPDDDSAARVVKEHELPDGIESDNDSYGEELEDSSPEDLDENPMFN